MLNSGASLASIAQAFAGSAEFAATIAGKNTGDIIDGLFQGLFGRPADPAGLQYWRPILAQNGLSSMAGIVLSVLNGAQGLDQQALDNRVAVADQFTTLVNGNATYNSAQDIANAREFLKGVTTSSGTLPTQAQITSFIQTRIADPGDKLYVTTVTTPPPAVAQTFTLTAGTDTFSGGDADDTFVGTVAGSFANGDSLDGGGNDTLTVTDTNSIIALTTKVVNVETVSLTSSGTFNVNTTSINNVWTGLKSLSLSLTGTGNILATTGANTLSITEAGAGQLTGLINTSGGTDTTIVSSHNTGGLIKVGNTTAVTGRVGVMANGVVSVTDASYNTASANTITTVALSNYGATSSISTNKLTNLSLSGTAGPLTLNNATNGSGGVPMANNTLALTLNGLTGDSTVTDTNNEITTLNVTTTGTDSSLAAFADTGLTTLNVAGSKVLSLGVINSSLTKIAVSGAAGFNDGGSTAANGFAARGAAAVFTTSSSGPVSLSLNSQTQTFVGSSGVDTIRISSTTDATQTITGGSSSSDELILEGGAFNLSDMTGLISGFETLGVAANVTGVINVANLGSTYTGLHTLGNSNVTFSRVASGATLAMDAASTSATVQVVGDGSGGAAASQSFKLTLGGANTDTVNFGTVVLNHVFNNTLGVGTVNVVSNGLDITPGDAIANNNTMALTDNGISTLNVSGTQGLNIFTLDQTANKSATLTLNNTSAGAYGLRVSTLNDSNLSTLNFTGTGATTIVTLNDATPSTVTMANTGSALAKVISFTSSALTNLTLTGNVQIGDGLFDGAGLSATATTGITVNGSTDHTHVRLSLGAAASGNTNTVTLGNGNNSVSDATTAGTSSVTVGTGFNFVSLGSLHHQRRRHWRPHLLQH